VKETAHNKRLKVILDRAGDGLSPTYEDILFILSLSDEKSLSDLFQAARKVRKRHFGNRVFLYGFLYFNTNCCNDCMFCQYRKSNKDLARYRKSASEIKETIETMAKSGVHLIDLTMGEIAGFQQGAEIEYERLHSLARLARETSDVPLMVSPGVIPSNELKRLASAGASWYACYQETYNRSLFSRMRIGQSFDARIAAKVLAREMGMLIEEGMLLGIGESANDAAETILSMRTLDADQVRVMTFVPQTGTPMADQLPPDEIRELIVIAILRLSLPNKLIPASLDVKGLDGLEKRLNAGANVVTSLVVPGKGLAGVANNSLDIEQARRTPKAILPILSGCGLEAATLDEYLSWIESQKQCRLTRGQICSLPNKVAEKVA
jgi:methylornithine synthase